MPTFVVDEYKGGRARSSTGDEVCVVSNTTDTLNTADPVILSEVLSVSAGPPVSIVVTKHMYFVPGIVLQLTHPVDPLLSIMVEVRAVTEVNATDARLDLLAGYEVDPGFVGAGVSVNQNFLRAEVVYGSAAEPLHFGAAYTVDGITYQNITVPGALWTGHQWAGQKICGGLDLDGMGSTAIIGNTADALIIATGGGLSTVIDVQVAIAPDFTTDVPFASRAPVWLLTTLGKGVTTLLEPTLDLQRVGTPWYGHNHMLSDASAQPIGGAWTAKDVGINITTPGLVDLRAKSVALSGDGLTLTIFPTTPMVVNAHVGKFLNPNQNQPALFKIVSNTATTITVNASMLGVFSAGQVAYVLPPRHAIKYQRVLDILQRRYVNPDIRVHLLFPEV